MQFSRDMPVQHWIYQIVGKERRDTQHMVWPYKTDFYRDLAFGGPMISAGLKWWCCGCYCGRPSVSWPWSTMSARILVCWG